MSDIIEQKPVAQQQKSPVDTASNKIREAMLKEMQNKIDAQVKKTLDASKIARNEKAELQRLLSEFENEKADLKDLLETLA